MRHIKFLLFALLLIGCSQFPTTGEFTANCTYTLSADGSVLLNCDPLTPFPITPAPTSTDFPLTATDEVVTLTPVPPTPSPTTVPTSTPLPTNTPLPSGIVYVEQLLDNGGFETAWRPVIFPEVNVFYGWEPFYLDEPYTEKTLVPLEWNPYELSRYFKRPEFKPSDVNIYPTRVYSGTYSQVAFAYAGVMDGGVFQTIPTLPGYLYSVSIYVQLWSAEDFFGGCVRRGVDNKCVDRAAENATSDIASADDRAGIWAYIAVDPYGGTQAFADSVRRSQTFGFADGLYDHYQKITYVFTSLSDQATIFFGCGNKYAKAHNDCYFDQAQVSGYARGGQ